MGLVTSWVLAWKLCQVIRSGWGLSLIKQLGNSLMFH
jgi:hypothetical protein